MHDKVGSRYALMVREILILDDRPLEGRIKELP